MEPHDELPGLLIIEHLRALDDATTLDVAAWFIRNREYQSMVGAFLEILGSEAAYAERAVRLAILRTAFAIPVVGTLVVEDVATVRIDMLTGIVFPYTSVHRSLCQSWETGHHPQHDKYEKFIHFADVLLS